MTELSTAEAAVVQRFEAAADAEESLRERVARAMCDSDALTDGRDEETDMDWYWTLRSDAFRRRADAAIAVLRGGA